MSGAPTTAPDTPSSGTEPSEEAWLIPVHPPRFSHLVRLLDSVTMHGIPGTWIPVFTTEREAEQFYRLHPREGVHLSIDSVLPEDVIARSTARRSIINVKKLAALWDVRSMFEQVHIIDSECIAFRPGSAAASCAVRSRRRAWPAHRHDDPGLRRIQTMTANLFDVRDRPELFGRVLTDRWLYSWFEDVPTYWRDDTEAFFEYFGSTSSALPLVDALEWETFDHLAYQYFCCLKRGWSLHDTGLASRAECAWWEAWDASDPAIRHTAGLHFRDWAPSWVRSPTFATEAPNAFLAFHQDR